MEKKYIVQNSQVLEAISIHGGHSAQGGHRLVDETEDRTGPCQEGARLTGRYNKKNYQATIKRRRTSVQELIVNNFNPYYSAMLTLTFCEKGQEVAPTPADSADDLSYLYNLLGSGQLGTGCSFSKTGSADTDVKVYDPALEKLKQLQYCNTLFKKFIQRMKYRYEGFKYVAVTAKQDNGRWHYHLICNLSYIPFQQLYHCWGHGAVYFSNFRKSGAAGFWAAIHYMQKNMRSEAETLKGEKGYLASKGLSRSKVYRSWVDGEQDMVSQIETSLKGVQPMYRYQNIHTRGGQNICS